MVQEDVAAAWTLAINIILPSILLLGIGWILIRRKWLSAGASQLRFTQGYTPIASEKDIKGSLSDSSKNIKSLNAYPPIEPLRDFQWERTEQFQLRPFRQKYHLTMAITTTTANELLLMDKTYHERINLRRKLIRENTSTIVGAEPRVQSSVAELYTWIFGTYLPTRYPSMFRLCQAPVPESLDGPTMTTTTNLMIASDKQSTHVINLITNEYVSLATSEDSSEMLRILGSHVDEDFFFLLPHSSNDGTYSLAGVCCCFPNGFNPGKLVGKRLREIHGPVPGYKEKLQTSMDRYFAAVPVGKFNKRQNWAISMDGILFAAFSATHGHQSADEHEAPGVDISKVQVRCEMQTLHRLPQNKAVIFGFHSYMYPLAAIKAEGNGPALAEAIAGLDQGNVPGFLQYKRRDVWGSAVTDYLLSDEIVA